MRHSAVAVLIVCCGVLAQPLYAQNRQRGQGATAELKRPLLLAGEIVTEDGGPLPQPTKVALICEGAVLQESYATANGRFSFQLRSRRADEVMSAAVSGMAGEEVGRSTNSEDNFGIAGSRSVGLGTADRGQLNLSGCTLSAFAIGFSSDAIALGIRQVLDSPDVGVITLSRSTRVTGTQVSLKTLAAPDQAFEAYEGAVAELHKRKPDRARAGSLLLEAVRIYPEFSEAWHLLARCRLAEKDPAGARRALDRAIEADPRFVAPHLSLARLLVDQRGWEETVEVTDTVLELSPGTAEALYLKSLAHFNLRDLDAAQEAALQVEKRARDHLFPGIRFILGAALADKGDLAAADVHLRRYLELVPEGPASDRVRLQLQDWEEKGLIARRPVETKP